MKKMLKIMAILAVCGVTVMVPSAKSIRGQQLNTNESALILKYNTEAKFHTSILPTYLSGKDIKIINTVQRKTLFGNWTNKVQNEFFISSINKSYIININLNSTADTRAIWANVQKDSQVTANLYINNGYDYDINITPVYIK